MYFKKMFLLTAVLLFSALAPKEASAGTVLTDKRINFIEMHADSAIRYGASFDMPWEVAMTISALESGDGDSPAARNGYNLHGIETKSGNIRRFDYEDQSWEAFYETLLFTKCYTRHDVFRYRSDPEEFLKAIVEAGYNPNPEEYLKTAMPILKAIEAYRDAHGWPTSRDYAALINNYGGELDESHPRTDYALYVENLSKPRLTINVSELSTGEVSITSGAATMQKRF